MIEIDDKLLEELLEKAAESPRMRANLDLRNSNEDGSQRMLNALMPGTVVPIHRHRKSSETVILLRGRVTEIFYDADGVECGRYDLDPVQGKYGIQIPIGQWHTLIAHQPSVILESKDGSYAPMTSADVWNYE